jgi:hypothetical protein
MPKKNSFLLVLTCALAMLLMAGRCSDDDDGSAPAQAKKAGDASPASADDDTFNLNAESGVEKDPIGDMPAGGADDATAPLEDVPAPGGDDGQMFDDPSFEPEPVPDEASDL